jgi:hypothetical protein
MQSMDWQTLVARRAKKDPPNKGGWNAFLTSWVSADILNPVMAGFFNAGCDKAMFGWPCDERSRSCATSSPRDRSGQAEGDRRGGAEAQHRVHHAPVPRPVVPAGCGAQERRRHSAGAGAGVLERREELHSDLKIVDPIWTTAYITATTAT